MEAQMEAERKKERDRRKCKRKRTGRDGFGQAGKQAEVGDADKATPVQNLLKDYAPEGSEEREEGEGVSENGGRGNC